MTFHCAACGADSASPAERPYPGAGGAGRPTRILFCPSCGFGQADPLPTEAELAELYAGAYWNQAEVKPVVRSDAPLAFLLAERRWASVAAQMAPPRPDLNVLDIGAGLGCLGLVAAASLPQGRYVAVEPDAALAAGLRASWPATGCALAVHGDLSTVEGTFDVIALSHLLEHVAEPLHMIEQALPRLAPGGMLLIEVPNADWRFKTDVFPHLGFFDVRSLSALLSRAGLAPIAMGAWGRVAGFAPSRCASIANRLVRRWPALGECVNDRIFRTGVSRPDGPWLRAVAMRGSTPR